MTLAVMIGLFAIYQIALAATATVNWQASADPKTIGYKVHFDNRSTPTLRQTLDVGNSTSYTFTNLTTQKLYCYAVSLYGYTSARHTGYGESANSNKQCGIVNIHGDFSNSPNYRPSGTDNPSPPDYPYNPLPDCTICHPGGMP